MRYFLFSFLFFALAACGSSDLTREKEVEISGPKPEWITKNEPIGKMDGQKVIYFYGIGESKHLDTAKEAAKLNAAGDAALAISAIVNRQINEATGSGMISVTAKNVNVSGMRLASSWWKQVKILKDARSNPPIYEDRFTFFVQFAMDYKEYVERRNAKLKEVKLTKEQEELVLKKLKEIDAK